MVALVGAMFVAMSPVSAQQAPGGKCNANPDITLGLGDTCTITLADIDEKATGASIDIPDTGGATGTTAVVAGGVLTIDAAGTAVGSATVTITKPDADTTDSEVDDTDTAHDEATTDVVTTFTVNVAGFAISKVEIVGDSDNTVKAGAQIMVRATVRSAAGTSDTQVRLTVPTTGLSLHGDGAGEGTGTSQSQTKTVAGGGTQQLSFTVNTAGAPEREYDLTFTADNVGLFANNVGDAAVALVDGERDTEVLTITIGDPGTGLASATLSLGNSKDDLPFTDKDETVAETGSDVAKATSAADGKINLVVEAFDSLGGKANSGSIDQIIVIAPGGEITTDHNTGDEDDDGDPLKAGGKSSATLNQQDADSEDDRDVGDVGQKTVITVSKEDEKPGQVTVYAIVSGPGGAARTEDITLTFSGPAASLMVADAAESLLSVNPVGDNPATTAVETDHVTKDTIKLLVTAEDSGGNSAPPPTSGVSIVITDPDGKRQGGTVIGRTPPEKGTDGKYYITLTGMGSTAAPLKAGDWTIKVSKAKLEATAMFAVAGAPADVAVSASATSSDTIGDVITVTATATDKDGNTVSDGTMVMFSVSENTGLSAIGTGHKGKASKDGSASVKYAVVGAGHSVVSAEAGDATGVVVISSTAGTAAAADEEVTLDCLNSFSGLATWTCDAESTASELFGMLADRGASAVLLWNGTAWIRYAAIDGVTLPGAGNDFAIAKFDSLWISY